MRGICVLGLGLIGGSLLRASTTAGRTAWGATISAEDAEQAAAAGYAVADSVPAALRRAVATDALVVLAVPLTSVGALLAMITETAPDCRLTDVVSVKSPVADMVRRHTPQARYVGGHPMAGTTASGWAAGSAELFHGVAWVVGTEDNVDPDIWRDVTGMALDCGAHVVPAGAEEHDAAVARVSHLPHVLAAVLAAVGSDGGPLAMSLAAGSFTDGTRVAGTRPELVTAMCEGNRDALLPAVDEALGRLGAARGSLASTGSLGVTVRAGYAGRQALAARHTVDLVEQRVDLTAGDAPARLRELGRAGGRVIRLDDRVAVLRAPADLD